jgi:hypothetical protein
MPDVKRSFSYWHLGIDAKGVSHLDRRSISGFERRVVQEGVASIWARDLDDVPRALRVGILSVGVVGDWHENPEPQWIVPLSGRWFVESMDGTRVEMGPGDVSFGGDQGTTDVDGRHGHRSGAVGNEPAVLLLVPVDVAPVSAPA